MTNQEINEAIHAKLGWKSYKEGECPIRGHGAGGWHYCKDGKEYRYKTPNYAEDISAAWEIVEKISLGGRIGIHVMNKITSISLRTETGYYTSEAETTPMAICLAFLKLP